MRSKEEKKVVEYDFIRMSNDITEYKRGIIYITLRDKTPHSFVYTIKHPDGQIKTGQIEVKDIPGFPAKTPLSLEALQPVKTDILQLISAQCNIVLFNQLPFDPLYKVVSPYLSDSDLAELALTSKTSGHFFKLPLHERKFLHKVVHGEYEAVEKMLNEDISLMFKRHKMKDYSGRVFESVSAFEYALWALDEHMWTLMLACILQKGAGKQVFARLLEQYNKVGGTGVTYAMDGKITTEKHFNFQTTIIAELRKQVTSISTPGAKNCDAIYSQWKKGVGGAQKLFPMHVVYAYCSAVPFDPLPQFKSRPEPLKKTFCNWATMQDENWFKALPALGDDFALTKGHKSYAVGFNTAIGEGVAGITADLDAMTALYYARTEGFCQLKLQLEQQLTADNPYQATQSI